MDDPQMYQLAAFPPLEEVGEAELPEADAQGAATDCRRTPPYAPQDAGPPPPPHG
ncbi:hypothetical protein [Streptomyces sp. LaBMicrA B280]|uniref:hypothetical protein n=1 Tax=Streptomyces sp. LaBMicrA B280 TaxID=3391001 RepID=UPI003BA791CB